MAIKKQRRSLKTRGHGLTGGDIARHHRAADGRDDLCVSQIDLSGLQYRGFLGNLRGIKMGERDRLFVGVARGVVRIMRDGVCRQQGVVALLIDLGIGDIGLIFVELGPGRVQLGLILIHNNLIGLRIDRGTQLTALDARIEVAAERLDCARDIGAHLHGDHGIDRSAGTDGRDDIASRYRGRRIACRCGAEHEPIDRGTEHDHAGRGQERDLLPIEFFDHGFDAKAGGARTIALLRNKVRQAGTRGAVKECHGNRFCAW